MGLTDRAKEIADAALERAGELAQKAAEASDTAREKAPGYLDRAAELAGRTVDAVTSGVDRATGGRFHEYLDTTQPTPDETDRR